MFWPASPAFSWHEIINSATFSATFLEEELSNTSVEAQKKTIQLP